MILFKGIALPPENQGADVMFQAQQCGLARDYRC
jgi:hypothetical protein